MAITARRKASFGCITSSRFEVNDCTNLTIFYTKATLPVIILLSFYAELVMLKIVIMTFKML